jgi:hypothetical protein
MREEAAQAKEMQRLRCDVFQVKESKSRKSFQNEWKGIQCLAMSIAFILKMEVDESLENDHP